MGMRTALRGIRRRVRETTKLMLLPYYYQAQPTKYNMILNEHEIKQGKIKLRSYPLILGINLSNLCNQKCLFCIHQNERMKTKNWLTPDTFERMNWLRFVKQIDLFAGTGESLVNPYFPEITRTVRKKAPHSRLGTFTNGLELNGNNLKAVTEHLDIIHISLNAARRETYDDIIHGGNYDRVMENLEELSSTKPDTLKVELSLILMNRTKDDIKPMIDLASKLRFHRVIICHFITATMEQQELGEEESLRDNNMLEGYAKEHSRYAEEKGVEFFFPSTITPPAECYAPWTTAYITNDRVGDRIFIVCCSGIESNIYVGQNIYSDFKKAWNCDRLQHIRATVNAHNSEQNNLCYLCKRLDRADPDWQHKIRRLAQPLEGVEFPPEDLPKAFPKEIIT